jgi:hypothetical protein
MASVRAVPLQRAFADLIDTAIYSAGFSTDEVILMRLKAKISLIPGAGSGIGAATAKTFAREGAAVAVVDLN